MRAVTVAGGHAAVLTAMAADNVHVIVMVMVMVMMDVRRVALPVRFAEQVIQQANWHAFTVATKCAAAEAADGTVMAE
eukprot:CAMPEP_0119413454 /NCGR_PEP_ID=MMETSP1335-20130426/5539_1 /TAXON_ID=259385 /ORGANISM="Chrysoculter rhomboideus, Strain RCC1486" /LENGTH=77 /DNA_ID=CAMNT_0007438251 /DNA_START=37 /DNA_END=270 /DNA_ORIENTATION=+